MKAQLCGMFIAAALLSPQVGLAQGDQELYDSMKRTGPQSMEGSQAVEVEAEVISVNKKTRELTLKNEDGENVTVKAPPEVRNFNQIAKGDMLKIRYVESLAVEIKKKGTADNMTNTSSEIVRSKEGQKPGGMVVGTVSAIGTIMKVDKKKSAVTVKGPQRTVTLHVQDKSILEQLKKGDQIEVKYTEALAVSIDSVKR
ncbi:hypothetical protein ACLVWU_04620 [Bdellovibrio sp. HCB290]|uniref:hypothetical protein n=1 Tax=Bdellovibrio sp. HCB290 TaxID=3394356 RepID=UPI0039B504CE